MGFMKLFWGFIFLFDFRINGFDILPDFIGYILFYQGLGMLEERNEFFQKGKKLALPMIFISLFDIYQVTVPISGFQYNSINLFSHFLGISSTILSLLIVYNICYGIANEASIINDFELETKAYNRWKLYLISSLFTLSTIILPMLIGVLFIPIIILSIISYILILNLMSMATNKL